MSYSIDVNVLLYASDSGSPLQRKAREFLDSVAARSDLLFLTWTVITGYIRIVTHPAILGNPLSPGEAIANIASLLGLPRVRVVGEGEGFWELFQELAADHPPRGNAVPDLYLAALLRHNGVRTLYTTDRDFRRFEFLDVRDPLR